MPLRLSAARRPGFLVVISSYCMEKGSQSEAESTQTKIPGRQPYRTNKPLQVEGVCTVLKLGGGGKSECPEGFPHRKDQQLPETLVSAGLRVPWLQVSSMRRHGQIPYKQ